MSKKLTGPQRHWHTALCCTRGQRLETVAKPKSLRDSLDTRTGAPFRAYARNSPSICRSSRASTAGHVIYGVCTLASAKFLCFQGLAGWSLGWGALKAKVVALWFFFWYLVICPSRLSCSLAWHRSTCITSVSSISFLFLLHDRQTSDVTMLRSMHQDPAWDLEKKFKNLGPDICVSSRRHMILGALWSYSDTYGRMPFSRSPVASGAVYLDSCVRLCRLNASNSKPWKETIFFASGPQCCEKPGARSALCWAFLQVPGTMKTC